MISLDQVILLEQKVESAVAKIQQLQTENDALRSKCEQLTNALSAKSEQLNTFETDQNQIEDGIKKALDRLNAIENSVLKSVNSNAVGGQVPPSTQPTQTQIVHTQSTQQTIQVQQTQQPVQNQQTTTFAQMQQVSQPVSQPQQTFVESSGINEEAEIQNDVEIENEIENEIDNDFNNEMNSIFDNDIPEAEDDSDENSDGLGFDIF